MIFLGSPAMQHLEFKRSLAAVNRIPRLLKIIQRVEARLTALEEALGERRATVHRSPTPPEGGSS
jgi:hypothetical protein